MEARNVTDSMSSSDGLVFFGKGHRGFRLEQLLGSQAEVMGKGTFGYSYKAYLRPDDAFVVKRLKGPRAFGKEKIVELGGTVMKFDASKSILLC